MTPSDPRKPWSTELLISVRSLEEATAALQAGVDILDFKEPHRGPLAAVDPAIWLEAETLLLPIHPSLQFSAALGESDTAITLANQVPQTFAYAKVGPSGLSSEAQLRDVWQSIRTALPTRVELVAVAYADSAAANCLNPESVIEIAKREGFRRVLVDTFRKDGRSTIDLLGVDRIRQLRQWTFDAGQKLMLAGSLSVDQLDTWLTNETLPDGFGLRGDVCIGGRQSTISPERVTIWRQALANIARNNHPVNASV